ncbi:GNAT family N-acetyltransferase [Streptomyces sp. NPDC094031]|uniref:GNAT family N-acetyltransferase n=1 Tax=Streptomyces sp. NPDC094031 TaxID=3155307 RepID=UPI00331A4262
MPAGHEPTWVEGLRRALDDHPAKIHISYDSTAGYLALDLLVVTRVRRNEGTGTAIMQVLTAEADRRGVPMALTPAADFGGSVSRLRTFYRRFGFVSNAGRGKDYATKHAMIRRPVV